MTTAPLAETPASALSASLTALVQAAAPGVVRVDARRRGPASGAAWAPGVVVTAAHVLERDADIELGLPDGRTVPATVVGTDPGTDLAVLRADTGVLAVPDWTEDAAGAAPVGTLVVAVGRPGRTPRAALGIVAAHGDAWRTPGGGRIDRYLESDLALFPGFSGSLLVDARGRTLGLNTAGLARGAAIAIPTSTVRRVVDELLDQGRVRRAWLGVATYPVRLGVDAARAAGQPSALLVVSVQPDSPASAAGLVLGDALLALDGTPVRHVGDLVDRLDADHIGAAATLRVLRAGELRDIPITLGGR
jgi:S1-C subfamily serine protease